MTDLTAKTIAELREGLRAGEFTARELAEQYNSAVASARALNAFTVETPEDALAAADAADKARGNGELGSLAGIPLGIKDLFATRDVDTTAGSRILTGFKPRYESTVTAMVCARKTCSSSGEAICVESASLAQTKTTALR